MISFGPRKQVRSLCSALRTRKLISPRAPVVAGAEIYGPDTIMGASEGPWITSAQRTFDQAYQQWNEICGGGIYWVRSSLEGTKARAS